MIAYLHNIAIGRLNLCIFKKKRTVTSKICMVKPNHAVLGPKF